MPGRPSDDTANFTGSQADGKTQHTRIGGSRIAPDHNEGPKESWTSTQTRTTVAPNFKHLAIPVGKTPAVSPHASNYQIAKDISIAIGLVGIFILTLLALGL